MAINKLSLRIAAVATVLAASVMSLSAQPRYGVTVGGNIPVQRSTGVDGGYGIHTGGGFSGGLMFEYQFEKCGLALDASVLYTRASTKLYPEFINEPLDKTEYRLGNDFLQIPLHAKYKFWLKSTKDLVGPFVYTGPSMMVRLDKDEKGAPKSNPLRATWDFGVGIDIINFLQISAGYRLGLSPMLSDYPNHLHYDGIDIRVSFLFDF